MRKSEVVKAPSEYGRDAGKHFLITEWPAARAEKWGVRCVLAYNRGGGEVPMEIIGGGMQTIFLVGVNTFLRGQMQADEVIPVLDELLDCVKIIRDPKARGPDNKVIATDLTEIGDDIEEIKTRWWLRSEVIRIHTNFSVLDVVLNFIKAAMKEREAMPKPPTSPA